MATRQRVLALALAAAATAEAFTVPAGVIMLRPSSAGRPALRSGARTVQTAQAIYEPAVRIGHGFDIHRLGALRTLYWRGTCALEFDVDLRFVRACPRCALISEG